MTATCVVTHPDIGVYEKLFINLYASQMTFDPTGSTVALWIGATTYAMSWVGAPVVDPGTGWWSQYARTTVMFVGSGVTPVGTDVALAEGRYVGVPVITLPSGQVVELPPSPIDVR